MQTKGKQTRHHSLKKKRYWMSCWWRLSEVYFSHKCFFQLFSQCWHRTSQHSQAWCLDGNWNKLGVPLSKGINKNLGNAWKICYSWYCLVMSNCVFWYRFFYFYISFVYCGKERRLCHCGLFLILNRKFTAVLAPPNPNSIHRPVHCEHGSAQ